MNHARQTQEKRPNFQQKCESYTNNFLFLKWNLNQIMCVRFIHCYQFADLLAEWTRLLKHCVGLYTNGHTITCWQNIWRTPDIKHPLCQSVKIRFSSFTKRTENQIQKEFSKTASTRYNFSDAVNTWKFTQEYIISNDLCMCARKDLFTLFRQCVVGCLKIR